MAEVVDRGHGRDPPLAGATSSHAVRHVLHADGAAQVYKGSVPGQGTLPGYPTSVTPRSSTLDTSYLGLGDMTGGVGD